jgi:hypothetical protein
MHAVHSLKGRISGAEGERQPLKRHCLPCPISWSMDLGCRHSGIGTTEPALSKAYFIAFEVQRLFPSLVLKSCLSRGMLLALFFKRKVQKRKI